jgi:hypothetical protein
MPQDHPMTDPDVAELERLNRLEAAGIARRLSKSERAVIKGGVTWSGKQRNRIIDLGIAPNTARGAPPLPRQSQYHSVQYALPLTDLGIRVRQYLNTLSGER